MHAAAANSAFLTLTRERPQIVARVRAALIELPQSIRDDYNVRRLVEAPNATQPLAARAMQSCVKCREVGFQRYCSSSFSQRA